VPERWKRKGKFQRLRKKAKRFDKKVKKSFKKISNKLFGNWQIDDHSHSTQQKIYTQEKERILNNKK